MNPLKKIFKYFLVWRMLLFLPVGLGILLLNYGSSYPFFEITYYKELPEILSNSLFKVWANFDGVHYLNIASSGYITEARFFPLFPLLIYILSIGNLWFPLTFITAIILPNFLFLGALLLFYKLLKLDYSEKISLGSVKYLLFFPTAFFFTSVYSEGLFLLLLLSSFYFARKQKWIWSILAATLLCTTRFVGICIIPALIYEFLQSNRLSSFKEWIKLSAIIFVIPAGLLMYALFNFYKWGNYLYFLTAQTELGNSRTSTALILPPQTLFRYLKILKSLPPTIFEWWIALIEILSFVFGGFLLYIAWRKKVRPSYLIYGLLAFFIPVLSGTFSGLPRYLLVVFPVFIGISLLKSDTIKKAYMAVGATLFFILLMFFTRAYFIA